MPSVWPVYAIFACVQINLDLTFVPVSEWSNIFTYFFQSAVAFHLVYKSIPISPRLPYHLYHNKLKLMHKLKLVLSGWASPTRILHLHPPPSRVFAACLPFVYVKWI